MLSLCYILESCQPCFLLTFLAIRAEFCSYKAGYTTELKEGPQDFDASNSSLNQPAKKYQKMYVVILYNPTEYFLITFNNNFY